MSKLTIILADSASRMRAVRACQDAPQGWQVQLSDKRSNEQNARMHAMLSDVAKQCSHVNVKFSPDDWKRLCVDMFRRECLQGDDDRLIEYFKANGLRFAPALDGTGVVALGDQTRSFPKYVASAFMEWLGAFGADRDVKFSDPTVPPIEAYANDRR